MIRRMLSLFGLCALIVVAAYAGGRDLRNIKRLQPIIDDGIERQAPSNRGSAYIPGLDKATSLTWVAVDSTANAFGQANTAITPLSYASAPNALVLLHRGAAPYATLGSGQLWYNISYDGGLSWRRVDGGLNGGAPSDCRYPSGAISNPAGNSDTSQCLFVYSAPNLQNAGAFGQITYGVDFPLGGGAGSGTVDAGTNNYTASTTIWTQPSSPWILWATNVQTSPNDHQNWRTNDYITVPRTTPPGWVDGEPNFINSLGHLSGMATNSGSYYSVSGLFSPDSLAFAFNAGYSKSVDNGATWGPWVRPSPDWMQATGLPTHYDLYDFFQSDGVGTIVQYDQDMTIDGNDRVHFFHVVVDSPWTATDPRGILEVYETGTGWASKWVTQNLNEYTGLGYPGIATPYLQQTGLSTHASISSDGQVLTCVWLDAATSAPADSMPDVWFSWRRIDGAAWSTPQNLTQTPGFPELLLHAAPVVKANGGDSYTVFLGRSYQSNINTYPPDNGVKTTFYVASYTFTTTVSTTTLNVGIAAGWNLISNPVTGPVPGDSVRQMYPTSLNAYAFEFSGGYVQRYKLANGKGYWEKFPGAIAAPVTGTLRTRDSVSVAAGWNIVGSISNTVDTSTIVSVPPGLRASNWFGYTAGYTSVTQLVPGKGYWVKSSAAGKFVLANPLARPASQGSGTALADVLNTLTITDSKGGSQTLYFGADGQKQIPVAMYAMPPAPPVGAFDARFETADGGSMVQTHGAELTTPVEFAVSVQSDAYPLTITWKVAHASYAISAAGSSKDMTGEGSMKIANSSVNRFSVKLTGDSQLPKEFALSQNYPNPFNPTTSIKYALPVDSKVTMEIYNVVGQRVRTLVSDNQAAGYHATEWNGAGNSGQQLSSGVYFLHLTAQGVNGASFNEIRKLMMLK